MYNRRKLKFPILLAGDIILFYVSLICMLYFRYPGDVFSSYDWNLHLLPFTLLFVFWLLTFLSLGLYEVSITKNEFAFTERLAYATAVNALLGIILFYGIPSFQITPRANLFLVLVFSAVGIFIWRHIFNGVIARANANRVLFFGLSDDVANLAEYLRNNPQFSFQPVVFVSIDRQVKPFPLQPVYELDFTKNPTTNIISTGVRELVHKFSVDTIVASKDIADNKMLVRVFFDVLPIGIRFIDFPIFYEMITGKIPVYRINELWFLENFSHIKNALYEKIKRTLDAVLAFLLAVAMLFLLPFIACALKLDSRGPIFYRQKRIGKRGAVIEILKFRSMVTDAENGNALWADENDLRVTRVGAFLRKTRLDELPQIINVLKGEMSFSGPRPERPEFVEMLEKKIPFYHMRHLVPPGLTGWAQINFPYGASVEDAMEKLQYDLYYIKHRSLLLDCDILLRTIVTVLSRGGR